MRNILVFVPKLGQEAGNWINLHNEEFLSSFFQMIVSRKIGRAGNVARIEEKIVYSWFWCLNLTDR